MANIFIANPKVHMEPEKTLKSKNNLGQQEQSRMCTIPGVKLYCKQQWEKRHGTRTEQV